MNLSELYLDRNGKVRVKNRLKDLRDCKKVRENIKSEREFLMIMGGENKRENFIEKSK